MQEAENITVNNTEKDTKLEKLLKSRGLKVFLFVLVFGLSLFAYSVRQEEQKAEVVDENGSAPTPSLPYVERQQKKLELIKKLPYSEEKFSVQYYPDSDKFLVRIKENPYLQNQELVRSWFKANDVDPQNVDIQWASVRGVFP